MRSTHVSRGSVSVSVSSKSKTSRKAAKTQRPAKEFAPTLGAMLLLNANHVMMHAGQFSVVRRKLGKPILF